MIAELEDRVLRMTADFDNYRKRATREKEEARQFASQSLLEELLPVLDNFEMALEAARDAGTAVRDGVDMILGLLNGVLNKNVLVSPFLILISKTCSGILYFLALNGRLSPLF